MALRFFVRRFSYCEVYSVLMNRPLPLCCWRREKRYADVFNRVEHGDERALHWLRYLMALGFEEAVLLETAADLRFAPEFVARHIAEWQHQNPLDLIITGCQAAKGRMGKRHFAGGNAGLALLHAGGAFHSRRAVYHPRTAY